MAAVAQQYYEEAAQNEQMGEENEVSHHCFVILVSPWRRKKYLVIVLFSPVASPALPTRIIYGAAIFGVEWT